MSRRNNREAVMKIYFQSDFQKNDEMSFTALHDQHGSKFLNDKYVVTMLDCVKSKKEIVDKLISLNTKKWDVDRLAKVDLSILRLGVSEFLYCDEIPDKVTISECILLAKKYGGEIRFIDGLLGNVAKEIEKGKDDLLVELEKLIKEDKEEALRLAEEAEIEAAASMEEIIEPIEIAEIEAVASMEEIIEPIEIEKSYNEGSSEDA